MKKIVLAGLCITAMNYADSWQDYYWHLLGHYHLVEEQPNKALADYKKVLEHTDSLYPYNGFLHLLFATNQHKAIVTLIPRLDALFKNNISIQLIFAQSLAQTGHLQDAEDRFVVLQQQHKSNAELAYLAAQAHSKKNPQKALQVLDEFLNNAPFQPRHCIFYFMKSQLYLNLNNKEKALEFVKKSLDLCPQFDKGWLLLGLLHEQEGNIKQAIHGYKTYINLTGPQPELEAHLNMLITNPSPQVQKVTLKTTTACMMSALSWYEQQQYEKALVSINECLKQYPEDQQARLFKINILSAMQQLEIAIPLVEQWMLESSSNEIWLKTLYVLCQSGFDKKRAISIFKKAETKYPHELLPLLYIADLSVRIREFETSLAYHTKAVALTKNNDLLKTKIFFNMAVIYYETGQFDHMKNALEQGQKLGANFPPLLNLLAYYYATHGRSTTTAQQLIDRALIKDKQNPHFLDTQALIWYKQRDYKKSAKLLGQLVRKEPRDYYINIHLAKTYHKLGNKKETLAFAQKASALASTEREKKECQKLVATLHL